MMKIKMKHIIILIPLILVLVWQIYDWHIDTTSAGKRFDYSQFRGMTYRMSGHLHYYIANDSKMPETIDKFIEDTKLPRESLIYRDSAVDYRRVSDTKAIIKTTYREQCYTTQLCVISEESREELSLEADIFDENFVQLHEACVSFFEENDSFPTAITELEPLLGKPSKALSKAIKNCTIRNEDGRFALSLLVEGKGFEADTFMWQVSSYKK